MTVKVGNENEEILGEFKMGWECREKLLTFFSLVTLDGGDGALDEMAQIKILQIVMIFMDPNLQDLITKRFVNSILKTCFQLFDAKTKSSSSSGN